MKYVYLGLLCFLFAVTVCEPQPPKWPEDARVNDFINNIKDMIEKLIKTVVPWGLPLIYEADVSLECMSTLLKMLRDVQQLQEWAVVMIDASVKVPLGLLDGTSLHFGDYDECLDIKVDTNNYNPLKGQYCTLEITPPEFLKFPPEHRRELYNTSLIPAVLATKTALGRFTRLHFGLKFLAFRVGLCIPSTCSSTDLHELSNAVIKSTRFNARVIGCETKITEIEWTTDQVVIISVLGVSVLLCVLGTVLSFCYPQRDPKSRSLFRGLVSAFSIDHNSRLLFGRREGKDDILDAEDRLQYLAGLRFASILVLIFGFGFGFPYLGFWHKLARKANHLYLRENFVFGIFGNAAIPFETLIYTSGLLFGFQAFRLSTSKQGPCFPLKLFFKVVFRSICGNMASIGLFLLFPLIGDGPLWNELVTTNVDKCRTNAWRNFLFIQTYWPFEENCMFQTALMSIIVFCALLGSFIIWLLMKGYVRFSLLSAGILVLASCVGTSFVNGINRFPPALAVPVINGHTLFEMFSEDLIRPYTHICSYIIGLLAGWYLAKGVVFTKTSLKVLAWCTFLGGFFLVFYIPFNFPYIGDTYMVMSALFAGSYRTIWSIALTALCFLCHQGSAGFVGNIVSWTVFIRLDLLTWHAYLLFPLVIFYYHGQSRQLMHLGYSEIFLHCFAFAVSSYFASYLMYILFTAPARKISCLVRQRWRRQGSAQLSKVSS